MGRLRWRRRGEARRSGRGGKREPRGREQKEGGGEKESDGEKSRSGGRDESRERGEEIEGRDGERRGCEGGELSGRRKGGEDGGAGQGGLARGGRWREAGGAPWLSAVTSGPLAQLSPDVSPSSRPRPRFSSNRPPALGQQRDSGSSRQARREARRTHSDETGVCVSACVCVTAAVPGDYQYVCDHV